MSKIKTVKTQKFKNSKRFRQALEVVSNKDQEYTLEQAITILQKMPLVNFDPTVEIVASLGIDTKHSDQNVRGAVSMPHGTGKKVKVAVFAKGTKVKEAQDAGADFVDSEELLNQIGKGEINFDVCIASPDMMGVIGRVAKILGPKGKMPNPKLGTVTTDVAEAVKQAKAGRVTFKAEKAGIVHAGVAKLSFKPDQIKNNVKEFVSAIIKAKPAAAKGTYLKSVFLCATMSPSLRIDLAEF